MGQYKSIFKQYQQHIAKCGHFAKSPLQHSMNYLTGKERLYRGNNFAIEIFADGLARIYGATSLFVTLPATLITLPLGMLAATVRTLVLPFEFMGHALINSVKKLCKSSHNSSNSKVRHNDVNPFTTRDNTAISGQVIHTVGRDQGHVNSAQKENTSDASNPFTNDYVLGHSTLRNSI